MFQGSSRCSADGHYFLVWEERMLGKIRPGIHGAGKYQYIFLLEWYIGNRLIIIHFEVQDGEMFV